MIYEATIPKLSKPYIDVNQETQAAATSAVQSKHVVLCLCLQYKSLVKYDFLETPYLFSGQPVT